MWEVFKHFAEREEAEESKGTKRRINSFALKKSYQSSKIRL